MATGGDLPTDVVAKILMRWSVKSLLRFKLILKSWRGLISSRPCISKHLSYSTSDTCYSHYLFSLSLPFLDQWSSIVGSCNGLIYISLSASSISTSLWNPATREFRILLDDFEAFQSRFLACISQGFGVDVGSSDYKVIRVIDPGPFTIENSFRFKVWRMSRDCWSNLGDSAFPSFLGNTKAFFTTFDKVDNIWVKDRCGNSWTKHLSLSFGPSPKMVCPLGCYKNNLVLMFNEAYGRRKLFLYDPDVDEKENFQFLVSIKFLSTWKV
ncbi:hypothetical protein NMG60_11036023 [Bertholletia excelsa]